LRLYLDRIGIKRRERPEWWLKPLRRTIKCWFKKLLYNVDPRETYDLDTTWRMWMYEHLKMFREQAIEVIDMTYPRIEYEGQKYSQLEMIDMMLDRLEFCFKHGYDSCLDDESVKYICEAEKMWAVACPYMWW